MKILKPADYKTSLWKNSGGVTAEIAIFPANATIENFQWRVSSAQVSQSGPFSKFKDYHRYLAVIEGDGLELSVNSGLSNHQKILRPTEIFEFSGDAEVDCKLLGSEVRDLNLIVKGTIKASMEIFSGKHELSLKNQTCLIYALEKNCQIFIGDQTMTLAKSETLIATDDTDFNVSGSYALLKIFN